MASLHDVFERFGTSYIRLTAVWSRVLQTWDDAVQRKYEKAYWSPLKEEHHKTAQQFEKLMGTVNDARKHIK